MIDVLGVFDCGNGSKGSGGEEEVRVCGGGGGRGEWMN